MSRDEDATCVCGYTGTLCANIQGTRVQRPCLGGDDLDCGEDVVLAAVPDHLLGAGRAADQSAADNLLRKHRRERPSQ
jgi:hypothetical protein